MTESFAHHERAGRQGDFTLPGAQAHYPPDLSVEPFHLDVALHVAVRERRAEGVVTHALRARTAGRHTLVLHAVDLEAVRVSDPDGRAVSFDYDGRSLRVDWEDAFEAGEERRLAIAYRVEDPVTGLFFSGPSDAYPEAPLYAATDHETERARHWLPTIDLPNVRPTLDFHLRADADLTILANGALVAEEVHEDGTKTAHWRLEQPCPSYLTCFAIGDFVRFDDGEHEGRPLAYFTSRAFAPEDLERSFGRTRDMLAWMTRKLDHPFPYPKYFQFALPQYGGAMENISLVSWDDQFVLDETLAKEWGWLVDQINVHEMAHSYFGDMVVCRDYAHAWLKESWATYVETLWLEDARGEDEARYDLYAKMDAYAREADESYVRPIVTREFNQSWQMYDRHLYPGGAVRLHMLRKELGDEPFFRGVRSYLKTYAHRVVETDDFRRCLEEGSGRSLGRFFDQWLYGKGYPKVKAGWTFDAKKKEGRFTIEQTQADEKKGIPVFRMPLDVAWVLDGVQHLRTVELERAKHEVVVPLEKEPDAVRIDPLGRTVMKLEFNPGDALLRRQLREAPDVTGRILAGLELCRTGKAKNVQAVREAWTAEPFWGVRLRHAEALARAGTQAAVEALAALVRHEQHPLVLEGLLRQAGRLRAPEIREAIQARLDDGLGLYRATQAAYEALGAQRDDAPYDRLVEAAGIDDRYGIEQSGALRALAGTRREEAAGVLAARTPWGATSNRARPDAVLALGVLAARLERRPREKARERLADLLRDPTARVRQAAVTGLRVLGDAEGIGPLVAYRQGLSDQEKVFVDRAVQALRDASRPRAAALEKQLGEVREELRRLEGRLTTLEGRHEGP